MTEPRQDPNAAAIDRLAQVVDHHAARIYDMLQTIADRLAELEPERRR